MKRGVIDLPNERSSHSFPTPRGGGLVIAAVVLVAYLGSSYLLSYDVSWGFVAGAFLIVIVSWLDDVYSISFVWRLLVHSIAAALLIYSDGYISIFSVPNGGTAFDIGGYGAVLTFCWIVWLINAYNFMDGIDGIAGVQAVSAGIGWLVIGFSFGFPAIYILGGAVTFASLAFLLHNWPPARIFMGDAGSAFLGFVFAAVPLLAKTGNRSDSGRFFVVAVLFVWVFVFDSVFTFIRRAIRGEKVWQAHRQHLYQRLIVSGYSHRRVTLLYAIISFAISAVAAAAFVYDSRILQYLTLILIAGSSVFLVSLTRKRWHLSEKSS